MLTGAFCSPLSGAQCMDPEVFVMNRNYSYLCLAIAQLAIACNVVIGKHMTTNISVLAYICIRFGLATLFITIMRAVILKLQPDSREKSQYRLSRKDYSNLFLQSLTAGFSFNLLFFAGLSLTSATSAGIITSSFPAILGLLSFWILKEDFGWNKRFAILLSVIGIAVLNLNSLIDTPNMGNLWGALLVLAAMVPEALYSIFSKQLSPKVPPLKSAILVNACSTLLTLPFSCRNFRTCSA